MTRFVTAHPVIESTVSTHMRGVGRFLAEPKISIQVDVWMGMRRDSVLEELRGAHTGPHLRLRASWLRGPKTLESRILPGAFLIAFLGLLAIQAFHALAH